MEKICKMTEREDFGKILNTGTVCKRLPNEDFGTDWVRKFPQRLNTEPFLGTLLKPSSNLGKKRKFILLGRL